MGYYGKPLELIIITDAHYYSKKLGFDTKSYNKFNSKAQKLLKDSEEVIKAAFAQIAKDDCQNILFCGDATCDGDYDSHAEFITLLKALKMCGKNVYAITSTHDYQDNEITYRYTGDEREEIPSAKRDELFDMYREFGPDSAVSVFREGMSYIADLDENYQLFALNSDKNGKGKSGYTDECKQWIKQNALLAQKNGKRIIAMTHHPILSPSPVYSLIGKNDMMGEHDEIFNFLADLGINIVFSGHSHIHDISYKFTDSGNVFYDVSTSALAGYPAYMRKAKFRYDSIEITSEKITAPVDIKFNGDSLDEHLFNQFFGMIQRTIEAADKDTETFAECASAISIPKKSIYKYGWLIKPVAKILNRISVGTVAIWTKAETGFSKADCESLPDKKAVDFIISLVVYLYSGDASYSPDTPEYRVTVGLMNIIDSFLKSIHLPFSKIVKDCESVSSFVKPLLYNSGICDKEAVLPYEPQKSDIEKICRNNFDDTIKKSKKGPVILALLILLIIILIPLLPVAAILLLIGYIYNGIKYKDEIRGLE